MGFGVVIILIAGGLVYIGNHFYCVAVAPGHKDFLNNNQDLPFDACMEKGWAEGKDWIDKAEKQKCSLKSHDNLTLNAVFLPSGKKNKTFVILVHGYMCRGTDMAHFAKFYHEELAANVLLPDNRGHGTSEGHYIGFGWHDRLDYAAWIKFLTDNFGEDIEIILHGVSMGGATVLMMSGEALPVNVKCIVSDCAYTSVRDVLAYQLRKLYKLPPFPIIPVTGMVTKLRAGFSLREASALSQIRKSKVPTLFIHGQEDTFVPFEMLHRLYNGTDTVKDMFIVPGAGHAEAFWKDNAGYKERVRRFVQCHSRALRENQPAD